MEGLATGHGSDRGATLRDIVGYRAGQNRNSSSRANQQQTASTNDNKEEENNRKKDTRELNTPLAELLPLTELWDALSKSLCKSLIKYRAVHLTGVARQGLFNDMTIFNKQW